MLDRPAPKFFINSTESTYKIGLILPPPALYDDSHTVRLVD